MPSVVKISPASDWTIWRTLDPLDHLNTFKTTLGLQQPPDEIPCHSFPTILKEATREWFIKLPTSSIDSFE